jgi:peroxiredoxin
MRELSMVDTPSTMLPLGTKLPPFDLPDVYGDMHSTRDFEDEPVLVMFLCNHCPFVKHIIDTLSSKVQDYQVEGLNVVAISSNDIDAYPADSPDKMREFATAHNFSFPYLYDESQEVAKAYKAACTPDFFLFDTNHNLVYRGQFDDSRPGNNIAVTGKDLSEAVKNLLSDKSVPELQKPSVGCNIKWKPGNAPDYFG